MAVEEHGGLTPGRIVVVAGVSSVGKTSVCTALQSLLAEPYLHVGLDHFFSMFPHHWADHPRGPGPGFWYEESVDGDGGSRALIRHGQAGARLLAGMRAAVVALLHAGNNVLLDEMPINDSVIPAWRDTLLGFNAFWVRLEAPLAVMEAREASRCKGRKLGNARGHADVQYGDAWDVVSSTADRSPTEVARIIRTACPFLS